MRVLRALGQILLAFLLVVLTLEVSFRLAGALLPVDRGDLALSGDHVTVICVGDSHTWGLGVGYPRRLAKLLGERSDRYRVVNLGVPGSNTAQVRERFEGYLDRYQPALVVLWVGINNRWNHAGSEMWSEAGIGPRSTVAWLLDQSRVVKFFRVWGEQSELVDAFEQTGTYVKPELDYSEHEGQAKHRRRVFGEEDEFVPTRVPEEQRLRPEEHRRVTEGDLRWMIERAQSRQVPVILVDYALPDIGSTAATEGIRAAAAGAGVPAVNSGMAVLRVRKRYEDEGRNPPQLFDASVHPTQIVYNEVGDMILEVIDREGYLPRPAEGG